MTSTDGHIYVSNGASDRNRVQSVERACGILLYLTASSMPRSLTDIAGDLAIHKTTAHRLLGALQSAGLVSRDTMSGHYQLGLVVVAMSGSVLGRIEILRVAGPQLRRLADETNETVSLWMRFGDNILSIEQIPGPNVLRSVDWLGQLSPLHRGSAAKAVLAFLNDRQIERYIRTQQQANSEFDQQTLLEQLAKARSQGYAVNREEIMPHEFAVGAPILNASGEPIAAVSVAVYRQEIHDSFLSSLAFSVMRTADTISRQCGYGVQARKLVRI